MSPFPTKTRLTRGNSGHTRAMARSRMSGPLMGSSHPTVPTTRSAGFSPRDRIMASRFTRTDRNGARSTPLWMVMIRFSGRTEYEI